MFSSAKELAKLQEQLESSKTQYSNLLARLDVAIKERVEAGRRSEQLQAELDKLTADAKRISAIEEERDAAIAAKVKAELDLTEAKAAFEGKVEQKVQELVIDRCASAGIEPIRQDTSATADLNGGSMSRKEFEGLSAGARRDFVRSGGIVR